MGLVHGHGLPASGGVALEQAQPVGLTQAGFECTICVGTAISVLVGRSAATTLDAGSRAAQVLGADPLVATALPVGSHAPRAPPSFG